MKIAVLIAHRHEPTLAQAVASCEGVEVICEPGYDSQAAALNRAADRTDAPLLARLDADDVATPGRFESQARMFHDDPSLVLLGGAAWDTDGRRHVRPLTDAACRRAFWWRNPFIHSTVMFRREAFEAASRYDPRILRCQDLDLWLRMARLGRIGNVGLTCAVLGRHPGQVSNDRRLSRAWEARIRWQHRIGLLRAGVAWAAS